MYEASDGVDGFVSLEVAPGLAHDTEGTITAARHFHELVHEPNLYVKIPATAEGVPAIRAMIGEGRNINITLLFSLERYGDVIEAYIGGLEDFAATGVTDLSAVRSVASFFVSRVDTEVDRRLDTLATQTPTTPRDPGPAGSAAVAQAQLAYGCSASGSPGPLGGPGGARGPRCSVRCGRRRRPRTPPIPTSLYVDTLIGPDTVNTMPDETIAAFLDHGTRGPHRGRPSRRRPTERCERMAAAGVDMADVGRDLEDEGVASFAKSFDELIQKLSDKANALSRRLMAGRRRQYRRRHPRGGGRDGTARRRSTSPGPAPTPSPGATGGPGDLRRLGGPGRAQDPARPAPAGRAPALPTASP